MDRPTLVRTLAALSPPSFDILVAAIPNAAQNVSHHGTVPQKAAELIRWAESPTGPGIDAVQEAYRNFP
jgi:hypothetical protein